MESNGRSEVMKSTSKGMFVMAAAITCLTVAVASAKTTTWSGAADDKWSNAGNWSLGVPINGDTLTWDTNSTLNKMSVNDLSGLSINSIIYTLAPDGVVLTGNALTTTGARSLDASFGSGTITVNLDLALPAVGILDENADTVINGVLSGAATSLQIGRGLHALYGANTFSGPVTLCSGNGAGTYIVNTLKNSGVAQSLGTGSLVQFGAVNIGDNGKLYYTGGTSSTDKGFKIGGDDPDPATGGVFANGSGALTWSGSQTLATTATARTFTLGGFNTDANTWEGAIGNNNSGAIALTKAGRGTWVLKGANTFTGAFTVNTGTLRLDYANNATVVNSGLAPNLGGGTLEFNANSSGSTQAMGNVTAPVDTGLSTIRLTQAGAGGMAVTVGTLSTIAGRSAVLFDLNGSGASSVTTATAITNDTATQGRVIIRTASGACDFAVNNGAANALYARAATATIGAANGNAALDYLFTDTGSIGTGASNVTISAQSLRIAPTLNSQTMTINNVGAYAGGGAAGLTVDGGGLIYDGGANDFTIAAAAGANGVSIRVNDSTGGFILHHMGIGKLTLGDRVYLGYAGSSPGTNGTATYMGLYGTGLIDWQGGVNSIPGGGPAILTIQGVTVRISGTTDAVKLDTTATGKGSMNLLLTGGGVLEAVNGNITRDVGTGAGAIQWKGDGGFSAYGGNRAVILTNGTALTWGSASFVPSDNALVLSSPYSDSMIDFQNAINFGGLQRVVRVANGSAAVDARLSGVLSAGLTGGLVKEGDGTLELTAVNTYGGETWVKAGTLNINGTLGGSAGASPCSTVNVFSNGTLGGTGTLYLAIGKSVTVAGGGTLAPGNADVGTLTVNGAFTLAEGAVYQWDCQAGVGDRVALTGSGGTLTLPSVATVQVNQGPGSFPSPAILFTATALAGATDLSGWTVSGLSSGGKVEIQGTTVVLKGGRNGTLLGIR